MPVFPLGRETVPLVLPVDVLPELVLLLLPEEPEEPVLVLLFDVELLLTPPLPLEEV